MHFYEAMNDGAIVPRHFVPMTSRPDEIRPTRISDVRKMWKEGRQVVPSVTTILNVLDKPALVNWKVDQHLRVAHGMAHGYSLDEYMAEVKRLTELEMEKAPSAGTDIHKVLEQFINGELQADHEQYGLCDAVFSVIEARTGHDFAAWTSEANFVHAGFGGQVDLRNDSWVIDFKSKQTADKFKPGKMAYDEHRMQLAAYREGLGIPGARCANVFICLEDGQVDFHEHSEDELSKGWEVFRHCLAIWNLQHGRQ